MKIPYKPKTILSILVVAVVIPIISYFFFLQLEQTIHNDLYDYGLIYSNNWADLYQLYAYLFLIAQTSSWFSFNGSIISFLGYNAKRTDRWRSACVLLLALGTISSLPNFVIFFQLDTLVNYDLYLYGLQFSVEWYSKYLITLRTMFLLTGLLSIFALAAAILFYSSTREKRRLPTRLFDSILIGIGTAILSLSIIYSSSILALIGLGLLFWGVIFTYITTTEYVRKVLFDTSLKAQQETLNRIVEKLEYKGETVYLPPQFFNATNIYKAYISKGKLKRIPTAKMMPRQKPDFLIARITDPQAVLVTPPGVELTQLFEKTLEKDFITTSLQDLQRYLPEVIVDELEVTPYFDMVIENDLVRVSIDDSNFRIPEAETELSSLYFFFDTPIICAIACIFAKSTGLPVTIQKLKTESKGKVVTINYRILQTEK